MSAPTTRPDAQLHQASPEQRRRVAVVGIGHRAGSWIRAVADGYSNRIEVVALCDPVPQRCHDAIEYWRLGNTRVYTELDTLLDKERPDQVVICAPESVHAEMIIRSLASGAWVVTEKPLCTGAADAVRILEAEREAGRPILMGFNYRHIPLCTKVKALLDEGAIGQVVSADLAWHLDYKGHGSSYFRRWHAEMEKSGGLLVTKATHHFDLANWWIGDRPQRVYAECDRRFFGPEHSPYGDDHAHRCRDCHQAQRCDLYRPPIDPEQRSRELGYTVRQVADYQGDLCVYRKAIDIYDTHALTVRYRNGAVMNYSLNAAAPFEGFSITIHGTRGRLETGINDNKPEPGWQQRFVVTDQNAGAAPLDKRRFQVRSWPSEYAIHVMPLDAVDYQVTVPNIAQGHGGGDAKIMEAAYGSGVPEDDPLHIFAGAIDGARSLAIGDAANRSAIEHRAVAIDELLGAWA